MNIYLTGIMGCGKTTLGKKIATKKNVDFIDLDCKIEAQAKMSIPEIFTEHGEEYFRALETTALNIISLSKKCVVACGGGIVLKAQNIEIMKSSGVILFINRDINQIASTINTKKRPLLKNATDVLQIYKNRERLYKSTCTEEILNNDMEETINYICSKYL